MHRHSWFNSNIGSSWGVIWFCISVLIGRWVQVSSNCRDSRMMVVIIMITQPDFLPTCESQRLTRCVALCLGVKNISPSLSPLLQRGFRECDIPPKLCRGTIGPPVWMWHISCGTTCCFYLLFFTLWSTPCELEALGDTTAAVTGSVLVNFDYSTAIVSTSSTFDTSLRNLTALTHQADRWQSGHVGSCWDSENDHRPEFPLCMSLLSEILSATF